MKILLHSYAFSPSIGGIETVSLYMAENFRERGHAVTVVTQTPAAANDTSTFPFEVIRNPNWQTSCALANEHDIVVSNGASIRLVLPAFLTRKPMVWIHPGYRLTGLDAGWANGQNAPYQFGPSIVHHLRLFGITSAFKSLVRLVVLRLASRLVTAHVAVSKHVAFRQPLPSQIVIPNPYDRNLFGQTTFEQAVEQLESSTTTFTFLGRLVTEKGADTLIQAFAQFCEQISVEQFSLALIGDGAERERLQKLAETLGVSKRIKWIGFTTGSALKEKLMQAGICILPSKYEEPMGVVALELMAAGKPLIVSRHGGLAESCGEACLTFENGDANDLAKAMNLLYHDKSLQLKLIASGLKQVRNYDPTAAIDSYLSLFSTLINGN